MCIRDRSSCDSLRTVQDNCSVWIHVKCHNVLCCKMKSFGILSNIKDIYKVLNLSLIHIYMPQRPDTSKDDRLLKPAVVCTNSILSITSPTYLLYAGCQQKDVYKRQVPIPAIADFRL